MITKFEAVCVILGVLISAVSALVLGLRWIYRQGVASSKLVSDRGEHEGDRETVGRL